MALLLALCIGSAYFASAFRFDASAETLVVKDDPDLLAYERIAATFSGDDFLLLTFEPTQGDPFTRENINTLIALNKALLAVPGVSDTFSALDIPLLQSPLVSIGELQQGLRTLKDPSVPLELAARELRSSPLFRELLISKDGRQHSASD